MGQVTIDLVTQSPEGAFALVLVEQGPWTSEEEIESHLRALQGRLYDCADVAVDGHLAQRYPESSGKPVVIRVAAYDTPPGRVAELVRAFVDKGLGSTQYRAAILSSPHIASLHVEFKEGSLADDETVQ